MHLNTTFSLFNNGNLDICVEYHTSIKPEKCNSVHR